MTSLEPKTKKFTYLLYFLNFVPPPPTSHQILKPITMVVAIFYYMY